MSLLMKALANAEQNNRKSQKFNTQHSESQQAAANIFTAAHSKDSIYAKLTSGLILLLILGIAWFSYQLYLLNQPAKITTAPVVQTPSTPKAKVVLPIKTSPIVEATQPKRAKSVAQPQKMTLSKQKAITKKKIAAPTKKENTTSPKKTIKVASAKDATPSEKPQENIDSVEKQANKSIAQTQKQPSISIQHTTGKLEKNNTLQKAYAAFKAEQYDEAKRYYRQVLKQDVLQTDALLGMAVIAQKQGRLADAGGWFKEALKSNPKNPIALAGLVATKPRQDFASQEALLKRLIQQQPNHAQHYANLGNLYASHQAWNKAQTAFFEANRHAKNNAQFAFNLAVSLEHLGKPKLAVQHYQRALKLVNTQQLSIPNTNQIEERLRVLQ